MTDSSQQYSHNNADAGRPHAFAFIDEQVTNGSGVTLTGTGPAEPTTTDSNGAQAAAIAAHPTINPAPSYQWVAGDDDSPGREEYKETAHNVVTPPTSSGHAHGGSRANESGDATMPYIPTLPYTISTDDNTNGHAGNASAVPSYQQPAVDATRMWQPPAEFQHSIAHTYTPSSSSAWQAPMPQSTTSSSASVSQPELDGTATLGSTKPYRPASPSNAHHSSSPRSQLHRPTSPSMLSAPSLSHDAIYPTFDDDDEKAPSHHHQQQQPMLTQAQQQAQERARAAVAQTRMHATPHTPPVPRATTMPASQSAPPMQHPQQSNNAVTCNPVGSSNARSPNAGASANGCVPVGLPVQPAMGEVMCPFCRVRLRYPIGTDLLRCGHCQSLSRVPPSGPPSGGSPPMRPAGAPSPSVSHPPVMIPPYLPRQHVQFQCVGCKLWLQAEMIGGSSWTRCARCQTVQQPLPSSAVSPAMQRQVGAGPGMPSQPLPSVPTRQPVPSAAQQRQMMLQQQHQQQSQQTSHQSLSSQREQDVVHLTTGTPPSSIVREQEELLRQAALLKAKRDAELRQQQQQSRQDIQYRPPPQVPTATAPRSSPPSVYPAAAHSGRVRAVSGDYSHYSSADFPQVSPPPACISYLPPEHSSSSSSSTRPPVYNNGDGYTEFESSISRRLQALNVVDEHEEAAPAIPSSSSRRNSNRPHMQNKELAQPLLLNEM